MIVCHCRVVSDRTIRDVIAAGATEIDEVARHCGAGAQCGGCQDWIDTLLIAHGETRVELSQAC